MKTAARKTIAVSSPLSREGANAFFVDGSPDHITKRELIVEPARKFKLPAMDPFRSFVEAGGLMAYGVDLSEISGEAAETVGEILKGAIPATFLSMSRRSTSL